MSDPSSPLFQVIFVLVRDETCPLAFRAHIDCQPLFPDPYPTYLPSMACDSPEFGTSNCLPLPQTDQDFGKPNSWEGAHHVQLIPRAATAKEGRRQLLAWPKEGAAVLQEAPEDPSGDGDGQLPLGIHVPHGAFPLLARGQLGRPWHTL